jgi:probable HAF family extracellular repeat protein
VAKSNWRKEEIMKTRTLGRALALALLATLAMTVQLSAQSQPDHNRQRRYKLYLVPPLGGTDSFSVSGPPVLHELNNQGTLSALGSTSIPDPFFGFVFHGVAVRKGVSTDLGALPPANVNTSFGASVNDNGMIVGASENGQIDPLTGFPEFEAVVFGRGSVTDLGNFGGNGSGAFSVNNRGQIVGGALNTIPDPYGSFLMGCSTTACFPIGQQMRASLWDRGELRDLGTLGGNDAVAGMINQSGQIAGTSYTNTIPNPATGIPSQDPFFYDHGKMVDIGNLGGTFAYANYMNESGQVVGLSTLAGDAVSHPFSWERGRLTDIGTFGGGYGEAHSVNNAGDVVGVANLAGDQVHHAFLWSKGKLTDLGTLGGSSTAWAINSSGQVVGSSYVTSDTVHAVLWEKGTGIVDLNDFIPPGSGLYLQNADYLNDQGQISGGAILDDGHERAYLLTPCDEDDPGDCRSDMADVSATTADGALSSSNAARTAQTADRHISNLSDLRNRFGRRLVPGPAAPSK